MSGDRSCVRHVPSAGEQRRQSLRSPARQVAAGSSAREPTAVESGPGAVEKHEVTPSSRRSGSVRALVVVLVGAQATLLVLRTREQARSWPAALLVLAVGLPFTALLVVGVVALMRARALRRVRPLVGPGGSLRPAAWAVPTKAWGVLAMDDDGIGYFDRSGRLECGWPWADIAAVDAGTVDDALLGPRSALVIRFGDGDVVRLVLPGRSGIRLPAALVQHAAAEATSRLARSVRPLSPP